MPTNIEDALAEAYATAPTTDVMFDTLEFVHPTFLDENGLPSAIRVVRDFNDLHATLEIGAPVNSGESVLFNRFAFDFKIPDVTTDAAKELTIEIDNVSSLIGEGLNKASETFDAIVVIYRPYLMSDLSKPQLIPPYRFILKSVTLNERKVTAVATFEMDLIGVSFPNQYYTPDRFPGLIR